MLKQLALILDIVSVHARPRCFFAITADLWAADGIDYVFIVICVEHSDLISGLRVADRKCGVRDFSEGVREGALPLRNIEKVGKRPWIEEATRLDGPMISTTRQPRDENKA